MNQNLTTLRNRINELGVAEALVQTQGNNRIVVELPGVQDTAEAKRVLGRTANLEFRLVADSNDQYIDPIQGKYNGQPLPPGTEVFAYESLDSGRQLLLNRNRILTGERVQNASSGFNRIQVVQKSTLRWTPLVASSWQMPPAILWVNVWQCCLLKINKKSAMSLILKQGPRLKFVPIYRVCGDQCRNHSGGVVPSSVSQGLTSTGSAELALMLQCRCLGCTNVPRGRACSRSQPWSGKILIRACYLPKSASFGCNLDDRVLPFIRFDCQLCIGVQPCHDSSVMSWIGASLTLPGIAGIVITIGMAVDANVPICERIREEMLGCIAQASHCRRVMIEPTTPF